MGIFREIFIKKTGADNNPNEILRDVLVGDKILVIENLEANILQTKSDAMYEGLARAFASQFGTIRRDLNLKGQTFTVTHKGMNEKGNIIYTITNKEHTFSISGDKLKYFKKIN